MNGLISTIKTLSGKKYSKYVSMSFITTMVLMNNDLFGKGHIKKTIEGFEMIDMNFYNSVADIARYVSELGEFGRSGYMLLLILDMVLVVTFFLLQATLLIKLKRGLGLDGKLDWLIVLPLLRSVMDAIETITLFTSTASYPRTVPVAMQIASIATPIKWIFLWITLATVVLMLLITVAKRIYNIANSNFAQ